MRQGSDMSEDNLLLVNTVKKYPCLYNFNIPEYMKKEDTDAAWNEVANCMGQTVHDCKEKWRNLRYSLLRSLKPHPCGTARKKYYLHNEMEFLLPFMKTRYDGLAIAQYDDDSEDENNGEETVATEEPNLDFIAFEYQINEPLPKRRKIMPKVRQYGNECPRKMFLLGLLPEISSLTEAQMKEFRRKVFTLIDNIAENGNQNLDTGYSNHMTSQNHSEGEFITIKSEPL